MERSQQRSRVARNIARISALVLAFVFAIPLLGLAISFSNNAGMEARLSNPSPEASATETATPTPEGCTPEFTQIALDRKGSAKVVLDFSAKVDEAVASGNKDAYRTVVLGISGQNGQLLAVYAHQMGLYKDPNNWQPLVDGGCLSKEGQRLYDQLDGAYHMEGMTFALGEAPANGTNSGVNADGTYGVDASSGIGGDRKAIEITLPDGSKTWIMVRCGNPVFQGKPNLPTVPTDNPPPVENPKCPWNPALPPNSPNCVQPKNPAEDPGPRGNAPIGQGPNADPGPGTYVPPENMVQPPSTAYVPPAPPAPVPPAPKPPTPSDPSPAPVPTPDPAPAPAPEPSAVPPSAAPSTCPIAPGESSC